MDPPVVDPLCESVLTRVSQLIGLYQIVCQESVPEAPPESLFAGYRSPDAEAASDDVTAQ